MWPFKTKKIKTFQLDDFIVYLLLPKAKLIKFNRKTYHLFSSLLAQMQQCDFMLDNSNLMSIVIDSDNMAPTYHKNDIVVIDIESEFSQDGFYAVRVDGRFLICRVQAIYNGFLLINDNPNYESIKITKEDNFKVIGSLVWKISRTYHV